MTPLQSLGDVLRRRRENLGMSLEELQDRTKIRVRYLEALEAGDWGVLPGDVYARGFVRRYAESVDLDGLDLLRAYVDLPQENPLKAPVQGQSRSGLAPREEAREAERGAAGPDPAETDTAPISPPPPPASVQDQMPPSRTAADGRRGDWRERSATAGRPPRKTTAVRGRANRGFGGQAAVVAGVLIVLGGGWWLLRSSHPANQTPGGTPATNLAGNRTRSNTATHNTTNQGNGTAPGSNQTATTAPGNTTNSTNPGAGSGSAVQVTAQPFQSTNPPTQTYVVTTSSPISVTVTVAGSPCWVSVTADGTVVDNSETLQPGTSKTWTGNQSVNIYVGHPPSISVTVNGQTVTLPPQTNPYHLVFQKSGG